MATLEDLDKRLQALEGQVQSTLGALSIGPQQKGPMPGWFRAARIEGNQMLINMVDSKAGVAPRISVTDLAGITRAEMGNLAAYTGPNGVNSPAMYGFREFAELGGLLSYGANLSDAYRRGAVFVDRILKGARPSDLPVEQASNFEFAVNLKTAKSIGVTLPTSILLRADKVIE